MVRSNELHALPELLSIVAEQSRLILILAYVSIQQSTLMFGVLYEKLKFLSFGNRKRFRQSYGKLIYPSAQFICHRKTLNNQVFY